MAPRSHDPWGEIRRDRDDISVAAAFFMTFALLGLVAWVVFFGTGWVVPAALDVLPTSKVTRTPAVYTTSSGELSGISFPITSTVGVAATANATTAAPAPAATATPKPATTKVRITGTNGDGVYLRRTPSDTDLWVPWPDNTVLDNLNEEQQANGRTYKKVRDPRGNVGWMPAEYLTPAP